ncbi:MAG: sulfatase-like hydrolase/transferase [Chloroflexi bacterium]|nr:sulfatase-like hydrolase/transferase [Chloroflexota bacterium]
MPSSIRDNVVLILTDQHRADALGAADEPALATPNLDRLAAEGIRFASTYCQSPVCMPSRTSLFTGRYPHQHGVLGNGATVWPDSPCFVRSLREAGLYTAIIGKLHFTWRHDLDMLVSHPLLWQLGFVNAHETTGKMSMANLRASEYSEYLRSRDLLYPFYADLRRRVAAGPTAEHGPSILPEEAHIDAWIGDQAAAWLARHDDRPFFLWVGPPGPHNPFDPPEPYASMYRPEDMRPGITEPATDPVAARQLSRFGLSSANRRVVQEMRAQYYGNISLIDDRIGRILDVLAQRDWLQNTWVIYTSDHGELLGDHGLLWKGQFYEGAVTVPLLIRPPDRLREAPRGVVSSALVELLDVPATLLDLAGASLDGGQGRSLLPLLEVGANPQHHRPAVISEIDHRLMVRTQRHKLVLETATLAPIALWDLAIDPNELENLAGRLEGRDIVQALIEGEVRPFLARTPADIGEPWPIVVPWQRWSHNPVRQAALTTTQ